METDVKMISEFEKGNSKYLEATSLRESGLHNQAIELYKEALKILTPIVNAPLRICLYYDMALALDFSDRLEEAAQSFKEAVSLYYLLNSVNPQDEGVKNLAALIEQIEEQLELIEKVLGPGPGPGPRLSQDSPDYLSLIRARPWELSSGPVLVYIDNSKERGYHSDLADFAYQGFSIWLNQDLNLKVERCTSEDNAQIKVYRVSDKLGPAAGQTLFKDDTDSNGKVWLKEARIFMYSSSRNRSELSQLEENKFFSLACHEAGHALGLDGHSPWGSDLMYFKSPLLEPSTRDMQTLKMLYSDLKLSQS